METKRMLGQVAMVRNPMARVQNSKPVRLADFLSPYGELKERKDKHRVTCSIPYAVANSFSQ